MKYNWSIIGHEKQLLRIENDFESGNISHAYLLSGSNSVGKYTVAKKMANILQCENDLCYKCSTCIQINKGSHIDTIQLEDNGESIKIEEIRKIIERLNMTRQSPYKILLIQSVERMTREAANSFLKILEEPPIQTVFIMTTDNVKLLLPTIISRVRIIKFACVSSDYLTQKLRELYPTQDEKTIKQVSLFSLGKTGKAVHLMEHPDSLAGYIKIYHDVQNFLDRKNIVDRFSYIEELAADESLIAPFFDILASVLRSKVLEGSRKTNSYINTLSKINEAGMLLKQNINTRLVLENLMISL